MKSIFACLVVLGFLASATLAAYADDQSKTDEHESLEFKYDIQRGGCYNKDGRYGNNGKRMVECGDVTDIDDIDCVYRDKKLRGIFIRSVDFSNCDFSGSDFTGAQIYDTSFRNAKFLSINSESPYGRRKKGTNFKKATIERSDLSGAIFVKTNIDYGYFRQNVFVAPKLTSVDFSGTQISKMTFDRVLAEQGIRFYGATFDAVEIRNSHFKGTDRNDVSFGASVANRLKISNSTFEHVDFINDVRWPGVEIINSSMESALIFNANFTGAKLRGNNFKNAKISQGSFARADLSDSDFTGATIEKDFDKNDFSQALFNEGSKPFFEDEVLADRLGMYKIPN